MSAAKSGAVLEWSRISLRSFGLVLRAMEPQRYTLERSVRPKAFAIESGVAVPTKID